ncbi:MULTISPECIES: hypothetical protein [Metallosphaera]|uniref:Uncharacterized protein n=3 Tax=Metallosphaera TaxID=41980 RepID=A4YEK2_METS5|nr:MULTISPECIES: hypothetical protein [Metallosphaera]ABP94854.1 hypothetical protein Msed_0679 [Metallosphaera sedula DSM 5348]AIM26841.1 hypothetical protein HA72_0679 [Metallosphaera sedula]AKV75272.1 hypothetical protein MsedA_0692 [Metallosphaera sedula]AKV77512.1 hypothetical protein MsedB_0692 [Metallosphaera sedula]AKV79759.1 hypothetical protein MsedC_0691 [Metallosphaera sedula]
MIEIDLGGISPQKVIRNNLGECTMFYVDVKDLGEFLLFAFEGRVNYVKIMRPFPGKWSCESALYNPQGLFLFDLGQGITSDAIRNKMEMIAKWY